MCRFEVHIVRQLDAAGNFVEETSWDSSFDRVQKQIGQTSVPALRGCLLDYRESPWPFYGHSQSPGELR